MTDSAPTSSESTALARKQRTRWIAFASTLVPYALLVSRFNFVCDDAFISFRYARNLAEGLGLRYNVGVEPPVEGYTNFLWVLWCAVFEWLGVDVTVAARATSVACGVLTLWWLMRFAEQRFGLSPWRAALPTFFLATFPPFAVWSTGGLATVPFSFALFATFDCLLREPAQPRWKAAAIWGVLAAGLRADGTLFVGIILAVSALSALWWRRPACLRAAVRTGVIVAAAVALHLAFRLSYYGELLPNTAHVKVTFSSLALEQGRNYLFVMWLTFPAFALIPLVSIAEMAVGRRWNPVALELLALPVGFAAYVAFVAGGDFMCMARLLVPSLPFLAALAALPLRGFPARGPLARSIALAWPVLLIGISLPPAFNRHLLPEAIRYQFRFRAPVSMSETDFCFHQRKRTQRFALIGRELARHTKPGESLVSGPIGAVGYYSRLFIYDSFGLVSREVAEREVSEAETRNPWRPPGHHKGVPQGFFLPDRPTYLRAGLTSSRENRSSVPGYAPVFYPLRPEDTKGKVLYLVLLKRIDP